ncbi:hypothetical protein Zm00014a_015907 [Zea mays]|uniref:Uncharacterized protein n=1 Tax=Zea mays TaxID=4577 RepID=A0A3L6EBT0_MAIZE|nr:hypothetical protein Zm00014a_015907 [Zea mays]
MTRLRCTLKSKPNMLFFLIKWTAFPLGSRISLEICAWFQISFTVRALRLPSERLRLRCTLKTNAATTLLNTAAATSERRLIEAPSLLVYHRKKKHNKPLVEIAEETMENNIIPALQMEGTDPVTAKKEVFLKQIVKEVSGILPAPANPAPKPIISEWSTAVSLRRSRRIAGMGAEIGKQDLSSRATKKVLKALKKTLPVMITVVEQLGGALGESGLLVIPCVFAHINQIIIDSIIVNWWRRRDQQFSNPK